MIIIEVKKSLLRLPRIVKRGAALIFDITLCAITVWFAFGLRLDQWGYFQGNDWLVLIASIGFSLPLFVTFGLYRAIFRYVGSAALSSIAHVFLAYTGLFFFVFTIIGVEGVPRSIGILQPILLFVAIGVSRYLIRRWLGNVNDVQMGAHAVQYSALIYGAGSTGRELAAGLSINKKMLVKGFIDDDSGLHGNTLNGLPVYSSTNLQDLIRRLQITDILLAIPSAKPSRKREIIAELSKCKARVRSLPSLQDITFGHTLDSDLNADDLLGREPVPPDANLLEENICGKTILVTGAGGSIGSELCRQIIKLSPKKLVMLDSSEHALYSISEELKKITGIVEGGNALITGFGHIEVSPLNMIPVLASVCDAGLIHRIFIAHQPDTIFHAAAYKHVPLVEQNPAEGMRNNVLGTLNCAKASMHVGASHFILISTDKAVRPTNVMGASKRVAELILQAIADDAARGGKATKFSMVRFGNVLGSSGSVVPLFEAQIKMGGPITLTHPEVTRYFMTIPEAAQLVIQSSSMAEGGDVFVLDMGEPVRIYDLAVRMIYLSGLIIKDKENPLGDIEIKITGLRPGEKLYEELLIGHNPQETTHPKIKKAHEDFLPWHDLEPYLKRISLALDLDDVTQIREILDELVTGYKAQ